MPPQRQIDDVTLGVLIARMDDMRGDVQGLRVDVRELITALPRQYVPRAELEERRLLVDERQAVTDRRLDDLARQPAQARNSRRWLIGLTVPSVMSFAALAAPVSAGQPNSGVLTLRTVRTVTYRRPRTPT